MADAVQMPIDAVRLHARTVDGVADALNQARGAGEAGMDSMAYGQICCDPIGAAAVTPQVKAVAEELAELLRREGGRDALIWRQRLFEIVGAQDAATAKDVFDGMYAGGRNFADFHIWRSDEAERIALNERVSGLTDRLRRLLEE